MSIFSGMTFKVGAPMVGVALVSLTAWQARSAPAKNNVEGEPPSIAAAQSARVSAEGRLVTYPGARVVVSTEVRARIDRVAVVEGDRVRKGDVLVVMNADPDRAALGEARARVQQAEADVALYRADLKRKQSLHDANVISAQELDRSQRDVTAAEARAAEAVASIERLSAQLDKAILRAPIDGVVLERKVDAGETPDIGTAVLTIADLSRTRLEAEVDEYDAGRVTIGAPVTIRAEAWPEKSWSGRVEEIPSLVVSRQLKPQDAARPTDTRVLLVKIALSEPTPLKLGQRVEVEIASGATK